MNPAAEDKSIIRLDDLILVTGAAGFVGSSVLRSLLHCGFRRIRCLVRRPSQMASIAALSSEATEAEVQPFVGNLLSMADCLRATKDASVVIHLAAGRGEKSFPDAFMNSVVTTRNLIEACAQHQHIARFVHVSSFSVYTNTNKPMGDLLDESCPVEPHPEVRGEAYCFAKTKQEELVIEHCRQQSIRYAIVRPGVVYGPGNLAISGRVGIGTFGLFLHLGGRNPLPLTYVENCADAIVLASISPDAESQSFNVVDDDLPSSRQFLRLYKRHVKRFRSIYLPKAMSYSLCYLWERYSAWSQGQLPPVFNRSRWNSLWRKTHYTNDKLKSRLGWQPAISTQEGLQRYFAACRVEKAHA